MGCLLTVLTIGLGLKIYFLGCAFLRKRWWTGSGERWVRRALGTYAPIWCAVCQAIDYMSVVALRCASASASATSSFFCSCGTYAIYGLLGALLSAWLNMCSSSMVSCCMALLTFICF